MSDPPTWGPGDPLRPSPPPPAGPRSIPPRAPNIEVFTQGWAQASRLSAGAFLVVGLLGQALAFVVYAAVQISSSGPLGIVNTLRLGGLYFFAFHHVTITTSSAAATIGARDFGAHLGFAVALMAVTGFALWLLFRAGRRLGDELGGKPWERAGHGVKVAVPYAVFSLLLSFVVPFEEAGGRIDVAHIGAFIVPLVLGGVAGGLGGLFSARGELVAREPWGRRILAGLAAGWRAFLLALVLSFAGLLVVAAVKPDATRAYVDDVSGSAGGAAALVHHVLALPNQSMWVLVPAMGSCDGAYGGAGAVSVNVDFLCYRHFPNVHGTTTIGPGGPLFGGDGGTPRLPFGFGTAPGGYFLFLLVPALATILGGRIAARRAAGTATDAVLAAVVSGVAFAVLVAVGAWLAGIGISIRGAFFDVPVHITGTIGPHVLTAAFSGLAWGVGGGALGAAVTARGAPAAPAAPAFTAPPLDGGDATP